MFGLDAHAPRTRATATLRLALLHLAGAALLAARLHLAIVWWRFGMGKFQTGWLRGWFAGEPFDSPNPLAPIFRAIADGHIPVPLGLYRPVAEVILALRLDAVLAAMIPITEIALAAAFLLGLAPRRWAAIGLLVNANLLLAAIGSVRIDGPVMLLELLLLAAGPFGARWGVAPLWSTLRAHARAAWNDAPIHVTSEWPACGR